MGVVLVLVPCFHPRAYMEIPFQQQHPICPCRLVLLTRTRVLAKLGGVALPMRKYDYKNTKIYSGGLTAIYTKMCTFQNFLLYIYTVCTVLLCSLALSWAASGPVLCMIDS